MVLFLITFLSIYSAVHLYVFFKAKAALAPGSGLTFMLAIFMAIMVVAPIAAHLLERHGLYLTARIFAYVGYTWMGLLFFFFCAGLCLDVLNLSLRLLGLLTGSSSGLLMWTGRNVFVFLTISSLLLAFWAMVDAWHIRLDRILVETAKLPSRMERLSIVQISDLHLGLMVGERRLARIIRLVREADPDVVVCTGDLLDARMDHQMRLAEMLAELQPPLGKLAVTGNHEFYAGIDQSERFLRTAGFKVLRNQYHRVEDLITIVGVDDPVGGRFHQDNGPSARDESELFAKVNFPEYTILLKHRPVLEPGSLGQFDLQLSGHTHRGQIFPFTLVTRAFYPRQNGLYRLDKGSLLHVSRGAGMWGPPMRFLSPPHVTLIELSRKKS